MLEQPFPANLRALSPADLDVWRSVKTECEAAGLLLYADESCSVPEDVEFLTSVCHGVNVKLEKSGKHLILSLSSSIVLFLSLFD